jgi:hypothetical protein|nr:MAG TPA: hypothetical protein [Bacteriophage sp.]
MQKVDFVEREYINKEDLLRYLRILDYHMSREELIEKVGEMPTIALTEGNAKDIWDSRIAKIIE